MATQLPAHSQNRAWYSLRTPLKAGRFYNAGLSPTALLMSKASTSASSLLLVTCPALLIQRCTVPSCCLANRPISAMSSATDTSHRIPCTCSQPVQSAPGETCEHPQRLVRASPPWSLVPSPAFLHQAALQCTPAGSQYLSEIRHPTCSQLVEWHERQPGSLHGDRVVRSHSHQCGCNKLRTLLERQSAGGCKVHSTNFGTKFIPGSVELLSAVL